MLDWLAGLWRRPRIADRAALCEFLRAEAAFVAQKATIDYCRARSGLAWHKLSSEPAFIASLDVCRWQAMAAVLADMVIVTEGMLRPNAGGGASMMADRLARLFNDILDGSPAPAGARAEWAPLQAEFPARLARAQLGTPHDAAEIAKVGGARVFDLLPIHASLRTHDREMVVNNVRFGMIAFHDKLVGMVRQPVELVRSLLSDPATGP